MACTNCSTASSNAPGCGSKGSCSNGNCGKMAVFNWLSNMSLPKGQKSFNIIEVRFKNGRKDFFINNNNLNICMGDTVAVEGSPGHDIGVVSLQGELVRFHPNREASFCVSESCELLAFSSSIY